MKNFQYAQPRTESEAVQLLSQSGMRTAVLAGGTDLVGLIKRGVESPDRLVNILEVPSFRQIRRDNEGNTWVGAAVHLDEVADSSLTQEFASITQVIQGISSPQFQAQGTLVGELLRKPNCWYYRAGHGLLAEGGKLVVDGDNRYHAILDNRGPAKFVNASRLAPALIAMGASIRVVGPEQDQEDYLDLAELYQNPRDVEESEFSLQPGQLVTHVIIPPQHDRLSASYEVRQGEGPDQPLAAASVAVRVIGGIVEEASVVLGQVAPTPWQAFEAAQSLVGRTITEENAAVVGSEAVAHARPLSDNQYKVQLAAVAIKRALLRAVGMETGGLDAPVTAESNQADTSMLS